MNVIRDVKNRMKNKLYLHPKCPCGEIGRHAILRGWCRKVCWFESSRGHKKESFKLNKWIEFYTYLNN